MKLKPAFFLIPAFGIGLLLFGACKKNIAENSPTLKPPGYSKNIPEIDLQINFTFQRANPDAFSARISDNFSIEQVNSLYNTDQKTEYFILRCKKSDGTVYQVSGTVDANDAIAISFNKTASITY